MKMNAILLGAVSLLASQVFAMSGESQLLAWPNPREALRYTTCGCADSCWTVDLRERRTHRLMLRLHCGCETLEVVWPGKPPDEAGSCTAMNDSPDKFERIMEKVRQLNTR